MIREFLYLVVGWLLIAAGGGLANVLMLTVMLPATSAVVITHVAFSRATPTRWGLLLALALGYLEDLHQGAPVGTLSMAYALAYLGLAWASERFHVGGWPTRMLAAFTTVVVIDLLTAAILAGLAQPLGLRRPALWASLWDARWHSLATALAAPVIWSLFERLFVALKVQEPAADEQPHPLGARR